MRGKSAQTDPRSERPAKFVIKLDKPTDATKPIGHAAGGKNLHNRTDTNRQFTGNVRTRQNFGDPLGSGKKQIQAGGKSRKGGGKREKGTYDH